DEVGPAANRQRKRRVDPRVHVEQVATREVEVEGAVVVAQQVRDARFEVVIGRQGLCRGDGSAWLRPHAYVARTHGRDEATLICKPTQTVEFLVDHRLDEDATPDFSGDDLERR